MGFRVEALHSSTKILLNNFVFNGITNDIFILHFQFICCLVYKDTIDLSIFTYCAHKLLIISSSLLVESLGFSTYTILLSLNKGILFLSFQP